MKKLIILVLTIITLSCSPEKENKIIKVERKPTSKQLEDYWRKTHNAVAYSDYEKYFSYAEKLYSFSPAMPTLKLMYADALMSVNKEKEANNIIQEIINIHGAFTYYSLLSGDFEFLERSERYKDLLEISSKDKETVSNSKVAFVLGEKDLIPEGVAYDIKTNTLFVSSIYKRKILAINADGEVKDFIKSGQDDILGVIGMHADAERRHLWVCSSWDNPKKILPDSLMHSAIYKFDIDKGNLIKKYTLKDTTHRFLNDLVVSDNGTVYITESKKGKVFAIYPGKDKLELFVDSDSYYYANGITISDDNKYLYVSQFGGTHVIDLENLKESKLKHPDFIFTGRVDGLAFYKNSLIMHQRLSEGGLSQYFLNETKDSIISKKIIERNNPLFEYPTTGEIVGIEYFYIANAQLTKVDVKGNILPMEKLDSVYILKVDID